MEVDQAKYLVLSYLQRSGPLDGYRMKLGSSQAQAIDSELSACVDSYRGADNQAVDQCDELGKITVSGPHLASLSAQQKSDPPVAKFLSALPPNFDSPDNPYTLSLTFDGTSQNGHCIETHSAGSIAITMFSPSAMDDIKYMPDVGRGPQVSIHHVDRLHPDQSYCEEYFISEPGPPSRTGTE